MLWYAKDRTKLHASIITVIFILNVILGIILPITEVYAGNTTPIIDGKIENTEWDLNLDIDKVLAGDPDNTAKAGVLFDDKYLYIGVSVKDDKVINSNAEYPWNDDSVEIYIDPDLTKGPYNENTAQLIFRVNDEEVHKPGNTSIDLEGIDHQFGTIEGGYELEVAIPWANLGQTTVLARIGITIHVNDKDVDDASADADSVLGLTEGGEDWQTSKDWLEIETGIEENDEQEQKGLLNGDFEDIIDGKPVGWTANFPDNVEISTDKVYKGKNSVKITDPDNETYWLRSSPITVSPDEEYIASVYSYNESGVSQVYIEFWDENDKRIEAKASMNTTLREWRKIEASGVAPENTKYATVLLVLHKRNIGVAYFDDARFGIAEEVGKELINGGFEDVIEGKPAFWENFGSDNVESSTDIVYEGDYSVKITDPSDQQVQMLRSSRISITPGKEYMGSVYSYNERGVSELYIEFWNKHGEKIEANTGMNSLSKEWRKIQVYGDAPEDAVYATLLLVLHKKNVGEAYFDNAQFGLVSREEVKEFPLEVKGYPRLYFTKEEISHLRVKAKDDTVTNIGKSYKDIWKTIELSAREYLSEKEFTVPYYGNYEVTYSLPPKQPGPMGPPPGYTAGDYPYWTAMSSNIQERLEVLGLAYTITEEEAFGERAKEYVMSLVEWNSWTERPSINSTSLDTSYLTLGVCAAYDMLYELFDDNEKEIVEYAIEEKGLKPLYKDTRNKVDHNIQMVRAVALGSGGCLLLGKSDNAHRYLNRATEYYQWYLDERLISGRQEGMLYTSHALENLIRALDQVARVTGELDLIEHPFLDDFIIRWVNYFLAPGGRGLANFSDSHPTNYFFVTMNVLSNWLNNGYAGWYINEAKPNATSLEQFLYYNAVATITPPYDLSNSIVLDEIGWAALRSGWGVQDTLMAFISNNSTLGHNHFDQNSFQIATNGVWLATDPGYQDFSPGPINDFTLKMGHNTIYVDGKPQSILGNSKLTNKIISSTYDYVIGDAAGAYGNPKLNKFDRHIIQVKHKKPYYYVMLDDLEADQPRTFEWVLYTDDWNQFEVDGQTPQIGERVNGSELNIVKEPAQMSVKFLAEDKLSILAEQYEGAESYGPYIKVSNSSPAEKYKFLNIITTSSTQGMFIEAADMLPPIDSSGKEYKMVNVAGRTAVFYRGTEPKKDDKDFITFEFDVPEDDIYDVNINFIKSPAYGKVNVYLDGALLEEVYDGYDKDVKLAPAYNIRERHLTQGKHTLKLEVIGKHEASGNYFIGINSIQIDPHDGLAKENNNSVNVDASLIKGDNVLGAHIVRSDSLNGSDLVLFKLGEGESYIADVVESDAQQITVSRNNELKTVESYSMIGGKNFTYDGKTIFTSDEMTDVSIHYQNTKRIDGTLSVKSNTVVGIYTAFEPKVKLNDSAHNIISYDNETGITYIGIDAGKHSIELEGESRSPEIPESVRDVIELIDNLPPLEKLELSDKGRVEIVRKAYEALEDDEKVLVNNIDILEAAEARISELEKEPDEPEIPKSVKDVMELIDNLPALDKLELSDKAKVEAARKVYDALGDDEKDLVKNIDILKAAEARISELEKVKKEEPKKEDPKKEDPKKEDPKKEDPKKEDPKKDDLKKKDPKKENPKKKLPKTGTGGSKLIPIGLTLLIIGISLFILTQKRNRECTK